VKYLILLLSVLTVSGCAQSMWMHPHGSQTIFAQDQKSCEYEALKATGSFTGFGAGYNHAMIHKACMEQKGYVLQQVKK
jgi:hypothetical protein